MKILVIIKQTFDTEAKIAIKDGAIDGSDVKQILNPYDEYAVEEAVQLKEKNGGEVVAVGISAADFDATLRHVLAMGCDDAVIIDDPAVINADAAGRAEALAAAVKLQEYDLLLCGYTMIDCGDGEVVSRLAQLLGLGQIMTVNALEITDGKAAAKCDFDTGALAVEGDLPLLIGVDKGINEPRYPGMKSIMQGRKKAKKAKKMTLADLGLAASAPKVKTIEYTLPPARGEGKILSGKPVTAMAAELVGLLHSEAKIV